MKVSFFRIPTFALLLSGGLQPCFLSSPLYLNSSTTVFSHECAGMRPEHTPTRETVSAVGGYAPVSTLLYRAKFKHKSVIHANRVCMLSAVCSSYSGPPNYLHMGFSLC